MVKLEPLIYLKWLLDSRDTMNRRENVLEHTMAKSIILLGTKKAFLGKHNPHAVFFFKLKEEKLNFLIQVCA